jgi:TolB protein
MVPDWSPDGKQIAFASERDHNYEIYVMNADGSNPRRLTNSAMQELYPRWSPDGVHILFTNNEFASYLLDVNTGALRQLTTPNLFLYNPAWRG